MATMTETRGTDRSLPASGIIPSLIASQVHQRPEAPALRHKQFGIWESTSWREFQQHIMAVALGLQQAGISAGDRIGLIADNEPAWLYVDLGAQTLGAISVAVYPTQVAAEVGYIMAHSSARIVFCGDQEQVDKVLDQRDAGELPDMELIVVFDMKGVTEYGDPMIRSLEGFMTESESADLGLDAFQKLLDERSAEDVAFIGYTSGTTGKPKGARLLHRNQVAMAQTMAEWIGIGEHDRTFCYLPLCHPAVRVSDAYLSMYAGASINFPESVETVSSDIVELAPTFMLGTPRTFEVMVAAIETRMHRAAMVKRVAYWWSVKTMQEHLDSRLDKKRGKPIRRWIAHQLVGRFIKDKLGLLRIRYATCGGSSVSPELLKYFWALGVPIREVYGTSETSGIAFSQRDENDIGTAGVPLPGFEARIDDEGELAVRGAGIFAGYLDAPEKTAEALVDGWYLTGDIARFDDEGRIVILDREKHVIRTDHGEDLSPSEIENKLKLSPYISDAMVIGDATGRVTALIQIEFDTIADWAQRNNIAYTTMKSMTENSEIHELIQAEVASTNEILPEQKRILDFRLLPRELDPDLDEITPTRKIKRNIVGERFAELIEEMSPSRT
jgi:long-chain acyl-CoA synthetase